MLRCMQPQEPVPLRVYAVMAISRTIERFMATVTMIPELHASLKWVIETTVQLIESVRSEELISSLQAVLSLLDPEEARKHAFVITDQLGMSLFFPFFV